MYNISVIGQGLNIDIPGGAELPVPDAAVRLLWLLRHTPANDVQGDYSLHIYGKVEPRAGMSMLQDVLKSLAITYGLFPPKTTKKLIKDRN